MTPLDVERVLVIAEESSAADGIDPLDEAVRLELAHRPEAVAGVVNENGFAILTGTQLALVVRPDRRGHERARALLARVPVQAASAWSHGDHPAARHLAAEHGWRRVRELLRLSRPARPVDGPRSGAVSVASDVRRPGEWDVRSFRPGEESEILRVNAAAFAGHPEQGSLTLQGLRERMAEPWFDPEDLLGLWLGDRLAAFHWVKHHSDGSGEVYVLAVDPAHVGEGLGRVVLDAGLARVAAVPVHLYVEADNTRARRLYESAGFTLAEVHAQYAR